jgi:hypothetical protein
MIKSFSEQNGGSRATAATSDHHAARLVLQRVGEPSADSVSLNHPGEEMYATRRTSNSDRAADMRALIAAANALAVTSEALDLRPLLC